MKIGVLLSGCGVYDGAEIQEAVLTLLAIEEFGAEAICIALDEDQYHVINHLTGEEMSEKRNMMIEAARISRGQIAEISSVPISELDALVIPGGFGSAKNFTDWAFEGPNGSIHPKVKLLLVNLVNIGKPIVALCVSPVVLAKAFEGSTIHPYLTIGSDKFNSPYSIIDFSEGMKKAGAETMMKNVDDILIDAENKIISAPCYMMEASILDVRRNIQLAINALKGLI
jgi:enhancing lycopene biosynthesis protein 2